MNSTIKRAAALVAVAALTVGASVVGMAVSSPGPSSGPRVGLTDLTIPGTIASNCSTDVTSALNTWFANDVPSGSEVAISAGACYLVSNTSTVFTLSGLSNVVIVGNGATFEQTTYNSGSCSTDAVQPILEITATSHLTIDNLNLTGPGTCGGAGTEGGYGVLIGTTATGNDHLALSGLNVSGTPGDGLAVLPDLGTGVGINTNVRVTYSHFTSIGYHVLTLEGVNGFTYDWNQVSDSGNFADLEVDTDCDPVTCGGTPTGSAQWNVTIAHNTFTDAATTANWISELQGTCIPLQNLVIKDNTLDATVDPAMQLGGGGAADCHASGLTITGNVSTAPAKSPCGGSPNETPPACAVWEIGDWDNLAIGNNVLTAYDGDVGFFPNTLFVPCIAVAGTNGVVAQSNICNNAWALVTTGGNGMQFNPPDLTVTGLSTCGNTWGLTQPVNGASASPQTDSAC